MLTEVRYPNAEGDSNSILPRGTGGAKCGVLEALYQFEIVEFDREPPWTRGRCRGLASPI